MAKGIRVKNFVQAGLHKVAQLFVLAFSRLPEQPSPGLLSSLSNGRSSMPTQELLPHLSSLDCASLALDPQGKAPCVPDHSCRSRTPTPGSQVGSGPTSQTAPPSQIEIISYSGLFCFCFDSTLSYWLGSISLKPKQEKRHLCSTFHRSSSCSSLLKNTI